jgi:hypothetical protein
VVSPWIKRQRVIVVTFIGDTKITSFLLSTDALQCIRLNLLAPMPQKMVPKSRAITAVKKNRTALYCGFLQ